MARARTFPLDVSTKPYNTTRIARRKQKDREHLYLARRRLPICTVLNNHVRKSLINNMLRFPISRKSLSSTVGQTPRAGFFSGCQEWIFNLSHCDRLLRSIPHRSPQGTVQPAVSVATVSRDLSRLSESGCASSRDHATKTQATGQGGTRVRIRHQPFARRYDPPTRRARFRGVGPPRIEPNHPGARLGAGRGRRLHAALRPIRQGVPKVPGADSRDLAASYIAAKCRDGR